MIKNNITAIVIVLAAVLGLAVAIIIYLFLRIRRTEAECDLLTRGTHGKNFVEIVNDNIDQVHGLLEEVDGLSEQYAAVLRRMAGAVQHVGVVRYDAFRDLGGMMSFSVALLDDRGNGIVMSSIYGRAESRTYAKPVVERGSSYELSPEEKEAIRLGMQSKEFGALPVVARDRAHEERIANLKLFHDKELGPPERPEPEPRAPRRAERTPRERPDERQEPDEGEEREPTRSRRTAGGEGTRSRPPRRSRKEPPLRPQERTGTRAPERLWRERDRAGGRPAEERDIETGRGRPARETGEPPPEREEPKILGGEELLGDDYTEPAERPGRDSGRPRGLNTPVERLRDREPGGE